jgi:hypothetical protein
MSNPYTAGVIKNRFSQERFPQALKGLMDERSLSYRQLAYKTKLSAGYLNHLTKATRPIPANPVVAVIAGALCVEPDFFIEYRLRQIVGVLDEAPTLTDELYAILLQTRPETDDIIDALAALRPHDGNGDHGHAHGAAVGF